MKLCWMPTTKEWYLAMQDEMDSLNENHTYELVKLTKGKKSLKNKWVYELKHGENGNPEMKDLGLAEQILGMHTVWGRTKHMLWLSQEKYVTKVLQRFHMQNAKPV